MVERANKPKPPTLAATPGLPPQPSVSFSADNARVRAELPTGESVEVLLYGATVLRWRDAAGRDRLWLSEGASLDGSRAVRGGVPVVFPVRLSIPLLGSVCAFFLAGGWVVWGLGLDICVGGGSESE